MPKLVSVVELSVHESVICDVPPFAASPDGAVGTVPVGGGGVTVPFGYSQRAAT